MIEKFNPSKQTPLSTGHVQSHTMLPTEVSKLQAELATAKAALEKNTENTTANLLCYFVDYYENRRLDEIMFMKIGVDFLKSDHNKPAALTPPTGPWGHDADKCETFSEACLHHIAEYNERPCSDCPLPMPEGKVK